MAKLLLFIPMYNCEAQIPRVLDQVQRSGDCFAEAIVVNNRSTDLGEEAVMHRLA